MFECLDHLLPSVSFVYPNYACRGQETQVQITISNLGEKHDIPCFIVGESWTLNMTGPPASLSITSTDMLSGVKILGVTYEIYSEYPDAFVGCKQTVSCGSLVVSTSDAEAIVPADKYYLIVASAVGHYTGYFTVYLGADGRGLELGLVAEMAIDQDRVVLSWGHTQDLDLWVYDKNDMTRSVGWDVDGKSASFAEGAITLDIDVQVGPGVETTQFMNMDSGTFEVWVNHYDNTFTSTQVLDNPATVDVYCYQCLDDSGQ